MTSDQSHRALLAPAVLSVAMAVSGLSATTPVARASGAGEQPILRLQRVSGSGVRSLDVPLTEAQSLGRGAVVATGPMRTSAFSLVGFTWRGSAEPRIRVRTRGAAGWSSWQVVPHLHDRPDAGVEGTAGLEASQPWWVGRSTAVDVLVTGSVRDLELALIDPGNDPGNDSGYAPADPRVSGRRSPMASNPKADRPEAAPRPFIRSRKSWGAKERWRNGGPYYNRTIQQVHVHHTATGNDYRSREVPALLRAIYRYHTHNLGWSDIGYNFLVDRFGRTWQGRAGGNARPVRGAHTLGFNGTSTGVAVLGTYTDKSPNEKVIKALVHLAAWKLDRYHRNPKGKAKVYSRGSDKYPAGTKVRLPVIDGHRDTNDTECPGGRLYDKLPAIRLRAKARVDRFDPPSD